MPFGTFDEKDKEKSLEELYGHLTLDDIEKMDMSTAPPPETNNDDAADKNNDNNDTNDTDEEEKSTTKSTINSTQNTPIHNNDDVDNNNEKDNDNVARTQTEDKIQDAIANTQEAIDDIGDISDFLAGKNGGLEVPTISSTHLDNVREMEPLKPTEAPAIPKIPDEIPKGEFKRKVPNYIQTANSEENKADKVDTEDAKDTTRTNEAIKDNQPKTDEIKTETKDVEEKDIRDDETNKTNEETVKNTKTKISTEDTIKPSIETLSKKPTPTSVKSESTSAVLDNNITESDNTIKNSNKLQNIQSQNEQTQENIQSNISQTAKSEKETNMKDDTTTPELKTAPAEKNSKTNTKEIIPPDPFGDPFEEDIFAIAEEMAADTSTNQELTKMTASEEKILNELLSSGDNTVEKRNYKELDALIAKASGKVDSDEFTNALIQIVREACYITRSYAMTDYKVEVLAQGYFLTEIDHIVETFLKEKLSALLPGCGFISEESKNEINKDGGNWIIDPIDGTTNYMHGLFYSNSVALLQGGQTTIGCVVACTTDVAFFARKGKGAFKEYLDGTRIALQISEFRETEGLLFFGTPHNRDKGAMIFYRCAKLYPYFSDIKRLGSASLDILQLTNGVSKLYIEFDLQIWSIAAAMLILKESGGFYELTTDNMFLFGTKEAIQQAVNVLEVELKK